VKNYAVVALQIVDDYVWNVYEKNTEQVIETFFFEEDAINFAKFLDKGGAFDGFTPNFILKSIPDMDIDARFQEIIA
jgi:hypothetical protein